MCYLKHLKLETFETQHRSCLFESFRWELEIRCAIWNFWNLELFNPSQDLLIWNFQVRLEMRYAIWNFLKLETFQTHDGVAYLILSDETWKRGAIWNFWNLKLFKPIMWVAYLKLSDKTWNEMYYLKLLKHETLQLNLFETFDMSFKDKKVSTEQDIEGI